MVNSRLFWFVAGMGALWAFHAFVRPVPSKKSGS